MPTDAAPTNPAPSNPQPTNQGSSNSGSLTSGSSDPAGTRSHLTTEDVAKVAQLALLELTESELERFTGQLDAVLDLAEQLNEFDVADVPPTAHPFGLVNVFRPDVIEEGEAADSVREEALAAGPEIEAHQFKVPPALGEAP